MRKYKVAPRKELGVKTFRWGCYGQVRWNDVWHHAKISLWKQEGLRVDSRRQQRIKKNGGSLPERRVEAYRVQAGHWTARKGGNNRVSKVYGFMFYRGGSAKVP